MDNEYKGKAYVIHFLTSKDSLHTSVIKLGYPWTFANTVQKKERKKERKKHMDNEYKGKAYVIHFLTSKDSLHTSIIKLGYP